MKIEIPELCLVILIGPTSSGKSTFARQHFKLTEIVNSDSCRAMVADSENAMDANTETFEVLHFIVEKRLQRGLLTVVDATNVHPESRRALVAIARKYHVFPIAIALNLPEEVLLERNAARPNRQLGAHVIRHHYRALKRSFRSLKKEGFRYFFELKGQEEVDNAIIERRKVWSDKKELCGPFDIIGDVHGCFSELKTLLQQLGYRITRHRDRNRNFGYTVKPPKGRTALFVGDLVDRGPASNEVLRLVMSMQQSGAALCVCGNHDAKLLKKLNGKKVQLKHGLAETMEQLAQEPPEFIGAVKQFLGSLISHYVLDDGKLVVAHAGLREDMQGRTSGAVRAFCQYGETTGEIDEFGLPVRYNWAKEYKGKAMVVFGHTPVPEAEWISNTIDIDTGCVFGGKLTALRYPERELVQAPAAKVYAGPIRPLIPEQPAWEDDSLPDIQDVLGRRTVNTRLRPNITIREENGIAALETMSRFAINPRWLIYLPPTMSPSETSRQAGFLEHPLEAFEYYRRQGVRQVVCEEKHMGSRAVVVIGKDEAAIEKRFRIRGEGIGRIFTRTGRAFFDDNATEQALLHRLRAAMDKSGFWDRLETPWALLDCELMPWSAKAQALLQNQYAAVAAAGQLSLTQARSALQRAENRGINTNGLSQYVGETRRMVEQFQQAYRQYCWEVDSIEDFRLAPFHLLAAEDRVHTGQNHAWHMQELARICREDGILLATEHRLVNLEDEQAVQAAIGWWLALTEKGGEGMVVKPLDFIVQGKKGLVQPAVKCRGREYLRIIYGPDYTMPAKLEQLRQRGLSHKRSMAAREFALGIEALERFVRHEPFSRVHECVFGVLALESEPVDPRL
ncbi:MAG: polynucleotide kinase-phosphatase [Phaeodactylibacter sp.]|nr:polynucleotide kinase-phosphatase [Phaeodactylibacter sp.]MCB9295497.1 polynucleotide kinase-phosphatase [Lewinellaceae bacterium]